MKFLHVSPSWGRGGREMRAVALMGMTPDVEHDIVALDGRTESLELVDAAVQTTVHEAPGGRGPLRRVAAARRFLRERNPDLLLTYNWGSIEWLLAARLERFTNVVHHEDGFGADEVRGLKRRRIWARRMLLPAARAILVPSRVLYDIGRQRWKQPPGRLHYLPNGVDVERFVPGPVRESGDQIVFGCVGRLSPEKNPVHAVESFARASCKQHARLVLVGDGDEAGRVRACASDLGLGAHVELPGTVTDTAPTYRDFDVYLIPSNTEQMPLVLLEAMASGLPVAATDVGDVRSMVSEANRAFIVPPGDAVALAAAMDQLAENPELRHRLGADNRDKVESEFEIGACYGEYVRHHLEVARGEG